ncbi:PDZ domain-containing protein [Streptomyces fulvoviolaceus]|uniref:PDZ domain-containing protein n=1 Tax=Streptomyces fulvoviolaceus TaxID=285535 RepID=UPI0004C62A79|nr:PDZ domain-containing protein [Streptomyces fulvoviolaceus]MCT9075551.1 PDZ domain-containing protein [Streptomyces fulvoviolaceus]
MEQTALRPKPMPGQESGGGKKSGPARRPHAARRRGRRLTTLLFGLFAGTVLVLSGVGLGTVGATVIGMSKLADLQRQAGQQAPGPQQSPGPQQAPGPHPATSSASARPSPSEEAPASSSPAPAAATLGLEAVDAEKSGAMVVGVHVPGPGYTAGLVRGDVLLMFGRTRVDSADDLARAVADARPGKEIKVTVRHQSGGYQQLTVVPGVVT